MSLGAVLPGMLESTKAPRHFDTTLDENPIGERVTEVLAGISLTAAKTGARRTESLAAQLAEEQTIEDNTTLGLDTRRFTGISLEPPLARHCSPSTGSPRKPPQANERLCDAYAVDRLGWLPVAL